MAVGINGCPTPLRRIVITVADQSLCVYESSVSDLPAASPGAAPDLPGASPDTTPELSCGVSPVVQMERPIARFAISTAARGTGQQAGSLQTPLGRHRIRIAIGAGLPAQAVFRGRRFTGEIYDDVLGRTAPERDWILGRLLWLTGCEPGFNRGGQVDTLRRYIYIHGTPDSEPMGIPASHGCIRMHCADLLQLFELVGPGTEVDIFASALGST